MLSGLSAADLNVVEFINQQRFYTAFDDLGWT